MPPVRNCDFPGCKAVVEIDLGHTYFAPSEDGSGKKMFCSQAHLDAFNNLCPYCQTRTTVGRVDGTCGQDTCIADQEVEHVTKLKEGNSQMA